MTAGTAGVDGAAVGRAPGGLGAVAYPVGDVLREITRGGLAGLIVGIVLAGVGGRLVMRLAALLVPDATGLVTENGNRIGTITADGTAALVVFIGLFFGAVAGSLWVVIAPWLPERTAARALVTIPIAVALGTAGLVEDSNPDFIFLDRSPAVVASLVGLVALFGPALVLVDRWLDRRLPHPGPGDRGTLAVYGVVTALGTALTLLAVLPLFLGSDLVLAGAALVLVGLATFGSWWLRIDGRTEVPRSLVMTGRVGITLATGVGLLVATLEVVGALGLA